MLAIFGITLAIFLLAALGLALGVLRGGAPLKGSCGGSSGCEACATCPRKRQT